MNQQTALVDKRPIGFWLKLVDRLIDDSFDATLGQAGLMRRHWQVLTMLRDGPATLQQIDTEAAPFLGPSERTTRPVVDDLCARGWAVSAARRDLVRLTEGGEAAHTGLLARVSGNRRRLTQDITAGEYHATVGVLRRMAINLGWVDPRETPADRPPGPAGAVGA